MSKSGKRHKQRLPKWLLKEQQMLASGALLVQPGQVAHVEVRHDPWCAQLKGTGPCNCNPDIVPCEPKITPHMDMVVVRVNSVNN